MKTETNEAGIVLRKLHDLAKTDAVALEEFAGLLANHIRELNATTLSKDAPPHYHELIQRCPKWPGLIAPDKDQVAANVAFIQRTNMGSKTGLNFHGKQWSRTTPEVRVVLKLIDCVKNTYPDLPMLSRENVRVWWYRSWQFFIKIYGKEFEDHPAFKHIRATGRGGNVSLSDRTWKRKEILNKLRQAFRSVASK